MLTEAAVIKGCAIVGATALGYLAVDRFCANAGVQEPLAGTTRAAIRFCRNLSYEFGCNGDSDEQRALRASAEMAARRAYANVMAQQQVAPESN